MQNGRETLGESRRELHRVHVYHDDILDVWMTLWGIPDEQHGGLFEPDEVRRWQEAHDAAERLSRLLRAARAASNGDDGVRRGPVGTTAISGWKAMVPALGRRTDRMWGAGVTFTAPAREHQLELPVG